MAPNVVAASVAGSRIGVADTDAAMTTATEVLVTAMRIVATEEDAVMTIARATLIAMLDAKTATNAVAMTVVVGVAAVTTADKKIDPVDTVSRPQETTNSHVSDMNPCELRSRQALASVRERANSLRRKTLLRLRRTSEGHDQGRSCMDTSHYHLTINPLDMSRSILFRLAFWLFPLSAYQSTHLGRRPSQ